MVDFASLPIPVRPYASAWRPNLGLAAVRFGELRGKAPLDLLARPHRLDHHQLLLVDAGTGRFSIDSTHFECRPGTLLWIRPDQVIQFAPGPELDASVLMFTETFPLRMNAHMEMLEDVLRPSHWQLSASEASALQPVLALLYEEFERPDQGWAEDLLKHLLAVVLLRIDQMCREHHESPPDGAQFTGELGALFLRFRHELERSYQVTRLVDDYATALCCAPRTLARACRTVAGKSTKDIIDARVALEARRLLAHTDLSVGTIARRLGFTEVTNFGKFFLRRVGVAPGAFRRAAGTRQP
ncbi:AraC family transcriptional regulator [Streptomyces sp. NPDC094437]|uniref:AraC family transcriptional regulator n=1 Tax=Streptomyces sp. NPDC094437 TaxID=3366060 RepID=UPI003817A4EF